MRKTRILLADDHRIVLEGLKNLLEPEFEIVGTVEDGRALVAEALNCIPTSSWSISRCRCSMALKPCVRLKKSTNEAKSSSSPCIRM